MRGRSVAPAAMWLAMMVAGGAGPLAAATVAEGVVAYGRGQYAAAIAAWRAPATAGDADAQYNLAQAYRRGHGVTRDVAQAEALYRKAAAAGHAQAQTNLGLLLFQANERVAAMPWLEKAAVQGEPRAQYVVGTAMFNADILAKDWPRAYAFMTRAAEAGVLAARTSLAQMEIYLSPAQRKQGRELALGIARKESVAAAVRQPPGGFRQAAALPAAPPTRATTAEPRPAAGKPLGRWRVQLGAFAKAEAARVHWATLSGRREFEGLAPSYLPKGGMVRLQAGPLPDKAAATKACAAARQARSGCFPLQP